MSLRRIAIVLMAAACPAFAADIVLTPPTAGGVSITNAAGNATRFRVGEDGILTLPGIVAAPTPALGLCMEIATGRVGTCTLGGGGTVTSIATGAGLSGGPITSTGTISLTATSLLPTTACVTNQIPKWNGSAWACAADLDTNSGGTVTSIATGTGLTGGPITTTGTIALGTVGVANGGTGQTTLPLNGVVYGQGTAAVATAVGTTGQLFAGTAGAPAWTGSPSISGDLTLADPSTATTGNIMKGGSPFIHNFGVNNSFMGVNAGNFAMTGTENTAVGQSALAANGSGTRNTAVGRLALVSNGTGTQNTAIGWNALAQSQIGGGNTAVGAGALTSITTASNNTAVGINALQQNVVGNSNVALGINAGSTTTGAFNILIGNVGIAAESNTMRIGSGSQQKTFIAGIRGILTGVADGVPVLIDSTGQLGTTNSSRRVKSDIADMDEASNALMKLRPVTFHYNAYGPGSRLQYGLIAEEVDEVYPGLVARSADGAIETVMYQYLPPMLLNEVQKQQRTIANQAQQIAAQANELAEVKRHLAEITQLLKRGVQQ